MRRNAVHLLGFHRYARTNIDVVANVPVTARTLQAGMRQRPLENPYLGNSAV